ncbi:MAG: type II toxin-antitoxin system VapC family toxin [Dehalococcoidia bacterium]
MRSAHFTSDRAFVDTSAHYALVDPTDRASAAATQIARGLSRERWRLYTTNFIVAETYALTLSHLGRDTAIRVLRQLRSGSLHIVAVRPRDELRAITILEQYADKTFSYTDATSFAVMERLNIVHAFSFDDDFRQFGFIDLAEQL